ncbi:hypothetical protein ACLKA6_018029 [Drosophila palustris]
MEKVRIRPSEQPDEGNKQQQLMMISQYIHKKSQQMRDSDATLMPFGCQRVRKSEMSKKKTTMEMEMEKKPQFAVYQGILTSIYGRDAVDSRKATKTTTSKCDASSFIIIKLGLNECTSE